MMKKKIIIILEKIHFKLFGHQMSETMKDFLGNLSWSFFGGGLAAFLLFIVTIIGGRLLGPSGYGKYNLILAYCQFLSMAVFLGLDIASVRAVSSSKTKLDKAKNISSFSVFVAASSLVVMGLLLIFRSFIISRLAIDSTLFWLFVLFGFFLIAKTAFDLSIRGLMLFKTQSIGRLLEAVGVVIFFAIFFFVFKYQDYNHFVYAFVIGSVIISLLYFKRLYSFLHNFDLEALKKQINYAKLFLVNIILGTLLGSADKIIVAKYLSVFELGIYAAYYAASVNIISQIIKMFNNVLFPFASGNEDKTFTEKLDKLVYFSSVPLLLLVIALTFFVLKLYGKGYGTNWHYIIVFSILGLTNAFSSVYNSIVIGLSKKLYKKYIVYNNLFNILNLLAYGAMIYFSKVSVELIVISVSVNNFATILLQKRLISSSVVDFKNGISEE